MKKIPLTGKRGIGVFALVDDEDYKKVIGCGYKWNLGSDGYARAAFGHTKKVFMHRFILNLTEYTDKNRLDHINGNQVDNRKCNLRFCTVSENRRNSKIISKANTSGYKGVSYKKGAWEACLRTKEKYYSLGRHRNPIEAAKAYDKKALELYGQFARTNFAKQEMYI